MHCSAKEVYQKLLKLHGPQGWWPLFHLEKDGGYHIGDYSYPRNESEKFEVCVGAILTQNTTFKNVEKCLALLHQNGICDPSSLLKASSQLVIESIRPSGYFNQKFKKLLIFSEFFISLKQETPSREQLCGLWGIGPETADSILLYAYEVPIFVVDAYTQRIFSHLGFVQGSFNYSRLQSYFMDQLGSDVELFQEYHALIVAHAKSFYARKPYGASCPLLNKY
ncbi:MAG: endonuclease III domain-containing protein [Bacteriovoracaceae bacterium]|nr:endonuclease III domain-containing protein [Bacteriovoracaceae bacterium]